MENKVLQAARHTQTHTHVCKYVYALRYQVFGKIFTIKHKARKCIGTHIVLHWAIREGNPLYIQLGLEEGVQRFEKINFEIENIFRYE